MPQPGCVRGLEGEQSEVQAGPTLPTSFQLRAFLLHPAARPVRNPGKARPCGRSNCFQTTHFHRPQGHAQKKQSVRSTIKHHIELVLAGFNIFLWACPAARHSRISTIPAHGLRVGRRPGFRMVAQSPANQQLSSVFSILLYCATIPRKRAGGPLTHCCSPPARNFETRLHSNRVTKPPPQR